ncbi:MAG: SWIM zinc finger family protein [Methanoregula sp.]
MSDIWERLGKTKTLDSALRSEIESTFGTRGKKALTLLDAGKIKKYRDFFVAEGRTASYIVDEDFCTCGDFLYRGRSCAHILAVHIAEVTGVYEMVDSWYQDELKK